MKGSPMTENQTPGPDPEDNHAGSRNPWQQGPQQPGDRPAATQYGNGAGTAGQERGGYSGSGQNRTEQFDQPQGSGNNTQELPGTPRPVYPQRQPFYGQSGYYGQQQHQNGQPVYGA